MISVSYEILWNHSFSGLGYILPTFVFWFFGSAEVQSWNSISKPAIAEQESQESTQEPKQEQQVERDDVTVENEEKAAQDAGTKL